MAQTLRNLIYVLLCCGLLASLSFADTKDKTRDNKKTALTKEERIFGLVTIYRVAKQHFAMFEQVPDLGWDKTFMEYLPLVEKEQSLLEYYQTLRRFTVLLRDGHTFVSLPDSINLTQMGNLPINLDYIEERWVVIERLPTEEILKEDLPPGSVVLSIQGLPAKDYIEKKVFPLVPGGTFQGKSGLMNKFRLFPAAESIQLKLRYPNGSIHSRRLHPTSKNNLIYWDMERFKKYFWPWHHMERWSTEMLEDNILYVRYGSCSKGVENEFAKLIKSMKPPLPKAMVLDLRGNVGGSTPTRTVQHLISKPVQMFVFKTPCSISYVDARIQGGHKKGRNPEEIVSGIFENFPEYSPGWYSFSNDDDIKPEKKHYDGPLVILTDRMTSSAAEDLVVILQGNNRAIAIGEPTHGSTGQPIFFDLPGGGKVQICTCFSQYPDGRSFVGVGAQPDILVKRTIKGITEKQDEVLDAAIDYIWSLNQKETKEKR